MTPGRCHSCPVAAALACVADPALCGLVASPDWAHHVRELSRIARGEPDAAVVEAPADPAKAAEIRAQLAERAYLRRCALLDNRCGCAWGRCLAGRGNAAHEVAPDDCRECVATSGAWYVWAI